MRPPAPAGRSIAAAALAAATLTFSSSGAANADVVETVDGRAIEGKIVLENDKIVRVETRLGVVELARSEVKRIVKKPTPEEELAERRKAAASAEDHFQLSRWCGEKGLKKESREELERAVALDRKHAAANAALGRVRDGDDWVTPEEKKRRDAAREREANEEKGLVEWQGRWVPREERDALSKGLVKVGDRWLTVDEANRAKGLERVGDKWFPAAEAPYRLRALEAAKAVGGKPWAGAITDHLSVWGSFDDAFVGGLAQHGEKAYAFVDRLFGGDGTGSAIEGGAARAPWSARPKTELIAIDQDDAYARAVDFYGEQGRAELSEEWFPFTRRAQGFFLFRPAGISVSARRERAPEAVVGHSLHNLGHVLANRHARGASVLPPWFDEAVAGLAEDAATDFNTTFCKVPSRETRVASRNAPRLAGQQWRVELRAALDAEMVPALAAVIAKDFGKLTIDDLEKGMGVVEFLRSRDAGAVERFHAALRKRMTQERVPKNGRAIHDEALAEAVGLDVAGVDAAWKRWFVGP